MQTTAIRTLANSLPQNEVILLTLLISERYIPYTDLHKKYVIVKTQGGVFSETPYFLCGLAGVPVRFIFPIPLYSRQINPKMINGMLSSCPILKSMVSSKSSWFSLTNSTIKRKAKIVVRQYPKKKPRCSSLPLYLYSKYPPMKIIR